MGQFIQLVVDGLSNGSIYAVLALAIVLVSQATGLINFAQGGMAVFSAYITWWLTEHGITLIPAILLSVLASFVLAGLIERLVMRRFESGDPDTAVVVTIGLLTLITGVCGWLWTYNNQQFQSLFSLKTVPIFGAAVSVRSIGTFVVITVIMLLLQALFLATKFGLALRAVAINPKSAALSGLPVGRLLMAGWGLAAALGAVAGALVAPQLTLTPGMMNTALVYALAAVILGVVLPLSLTGNRSAEVTNPELLTPPMTSTSLPPGSSSAACCPRGDDNCVTMADQVLVDGSYSSAPCEKVRGREW